MKTFCLSAGLFILSAFCALAAGPPFAALLRNDITTNSFFGGITAGQAPIWDAVNGRFTNGAVSATATNAISDINGSSSNHQYIVLWSATETSNTFGIQTATGAGGATNFFHLPTADATHSGMISSADWIQFNNITATNFNANQFTLGSKIVAIKIGALTTNGIVYVTNFNATLYQQPHWTSDPTASDRPQLVTSNGIPIITVRYTNDSQGGLHSILYLGGGNTVNDANKRFEGIHMEFPNILDLNSDSNYVGMAMNFADVFAYGMHQYRFILEDPPGTSGQINYNGISTDPLFTALRYGDAFTATRLFGRDLTFETTVRSFGISNVVINQSASSTANALAKFAGTGGNIVQNSGLIALSDNSLYVPGTLTNLGHVFSGTVVTNTFLYLGSGGVVITGAFSTGLTFSGGILTASAGAPSVQTNSVAVGSQGTINLIAGSGISFLATNNAGASKTDVQIISSGGSGALATNANQFGASVTLTVKNGASLTNVIRDAQTPILSQATNFIFDGGKGDYYVWGLSNTVSTTPFNYIITNLQQMMRIDTWVTNGQSVIIQVADGTIGTTVPATWYKDQAIVNVDTNGHSTIYIWRNSLGTNLLVETRTYNLAAGNNLAIVTNSVLGSLTMSMPASPTFTNTITLAGTIGTQVPFLKFMSTNNSSFMAFSQPSGWVPTNSYVWAFDGVPVAGQVLSINAVVKTAGQNDIYLTNVANSGSTQMVAAAIGNLTETNQIIYIPQDYNGSNTVNDYAWDMSLNTFKPVTNFVNTNMVFTLSNITKSASLISEFIGNPGTTNTVLIKAVSGANIKWKGWNTNNNGGGIYVRGGYSYTFQAFADRTTNISAWVTTDDPYAVGPIVSIVTNDLVINVRYTNTASTVSYVQCSMTLNASVTDIAQAVLLIDQNGDGTWDAWITNRIGSGVAMADSILMGGWVTNSGIFLITNQSTGSATATINPNSSQRISGFGTGPQGLTGPAGVQAFNSLPQSQTNYLPLYDRKMAWGKYEPNGTTTPVGQGDLGVISVSGTLQADSNPSETNSHYGIIRATLSGVMQASIIPQQSQGLFVPTNRVFLYTATVGFSNSPGTNQMHMGVANGTAFSFGDTVARCGWVAVTAGSSQTNWVAQYRSNNSAQITVYTGTTNQMTDQWHTLGIGNTNGSTLVWYMDGVPVATLATPGLASPGGLGAIPVLGQRVILSPNGTNFMFWQDFELIHEKTTPVGTGPL